MELPDKWADTTDGQFFPDLSDDEDDAEIKEENETVKQDEHWTSGDSNDNIRSSDSSDRSIDSPSVPDAFMYCPKCFEWVKTDCATHPTNFIGNGNEYVSLDQKTASAMVFKSIPANAIFGPCEGRVVEMNSPGQAIDGSYLWEIDTFGPDKRFFYGDESHWISHIKLAADGSKPNIYAVQVCGEIYFRAIRDIDPDEPLVIHQHNRRASHVFNPVLEYNVKLSKQQRKTKRSRPIDTLYSRDPGVDVWKCRLCSFQTDIYSRMRYHCKMAHISSDEKQFTCNVCSKKLSSRTSLDTHMKLHNTSDRKFVCEKCDWSFRLAHHLRRHHEAVHGANAKTPREFVDAYHCSICQKKFATKLAQKQHMKLDHKDRSTSPATCPECGKMVKNDVALKVHFTKKHKKELESPEKAKHVCKFCDKRFSTKSDLRYHVMRHTGEFPYKCDKCNSGYPTSSELRKHQKISKKCMKNDKMEETAAVTDA